MACHIAVPPSFPLVSCDESSVRLQGLSVPSAGRVEVCVGGVWGTVCSPPNRNGQWSLKNAQVVCRELGYITATNTLPLERSALSLCVHDVCVFNTAEK